jgi:hypothetical protein
MERLMKVFCVVGAAVLVSSVASAGTFYWGLPGNWTDTAIAGYGTAPDASLGDYVYLYATATPATPLTITAGSTVGADFMLFDPWGVYANTAMVVNGSYSDAAGPAGGYGWYMGPWNGAGGSVDIIVNDGGSVDVAYVTVYNSAAGGTSGGDYEIVLNGGTFTARDALIPNVDENFTFVINIADYDATLICPQEDFDLINSMGGIVGADTIYMEDLGDGMGSYSLNVPEPATMVLLGLGALLLRRKK